MNFIITLEEEQELKSFRLYETARSLHIFVKVFPY